MVTEQRYRECLHIIANKDTYYKKSIQDAQKDFDIYLKNNNTKK